MRTGLSVDSEEVLSVCLGEPELQLRASSVTIQSAVTTLKWGKSDTKDFLNPDKTDGIVVTRKCSIRRRALNVYLSRIPDHLKDELIRGIFKLHYKSLIIHYYILVYTN